MDSSLAIETVGLTKRFGSSMAVDGLSFGVQTGEIFGFMGHNGAGKTTTLKLLLGLLRPTAGRGRVLGYDIVGDSLSVRRVCGFLPGDFGLPKELTARRFLRYVGAMYGACGRPLEQQIGELLARFGLEGVADQRLGEFSSGMAQKVGLAQALLPEPRVLLLDEPTSGLDPLGRQDLLELLRKLASEDGVTVLFSTHILSDVEQLCERAAVLHKGRLIATGVIDDLKRCHGVNRMDDLYLELVKGNS